MSSACPHCGWAPVEGTRCPRCGVDVGRYRADRAAESAPAPATVAPVPSPAAAPAVVAGPAPAGFWIRVGAVLIDVVCATAAETLFALLAWGLLDERLATAASRAFRFLASPCYFIFFHWAWGQTLGKMAFRIRVVDLAGGPLSFGQAVLRHIGSWLSAVILGIGYLLVAFRVDKRGLHDLIARTRVEHLT
jgi:uncharacterized RDD family membrane protein YckC